MKHAFFLFKCLCTLLLGAMASISTAAEPKVILFSPVENTITTKALVLFKGKTQDTNALTINNTPVPIDESGRFFTKITLDTPNTYHTFVLKAEALSGQSQSLTRRVYYKEPPTKNIPESPQITLKSPIQDLITTELTVPFTGTVEHATRLELNSTPIPITENGTFSYTYTLNPDKKTEQFRLVAYSADNSLNHTLNRNITHQSKPPPELSIQLEHPENNFVSESDTIMFKGQVFNAKKLTLNGKDITLTPEGKFLIHNPLAEINDYNRFTLEATAEDGHIINETRNIYYRKPQPPETALTSDDIRTKDIEYKIPTIVIDTPQNNMVTYKNKVTVKGRVQYTNELYINNRAIQLDKSGLFSESFDIETVGKYVFNIYALGENGLNTTQLLKAFKLDEPSEQVKKNTDSDMDHQLSKKLSKQISIELAGADIRDVLSVLARKGDLNLVSDKTLQGEIFVSLQDISLLDAIDFVLGSQGLAYKIVGNTIMVGNKASLDQPTRLETRIIRLNNINATLVKPIITEYLVGGETIQTQENIIILTADSKKISKITQIISKLDAEKIPQIILEAQILEVSKSILDSMGVSWADTYGVGVDIKNTDGTFTYSGSFALSTVISMLESEGKARVLAKPRIKAVHGEQAEIFIGDKIPYTELSVGAGGTIAESISYVDAGISLTLLPEINVRTQEIKIKIAPEVSYINGYKGKNNDIPVVRTRRVNTSVFVKNGYTVLIGGLFNSSDSDTSSGFPFFSKIPVLGNLFRSNRKQKDETELVIAITPKIINEEFEETIPLPIKDSTPPLTSMKQKNKK